MRSGVVAAVLMTRGFLYIIAKSSGFFAGFYNTKPKEKTVLLETGSAPGIKDPNAQICRALRPRWESP